MDLRHSADFMGTNIYFEKFIDTSDIASALITLDKQIVIAERTIIKLARIRAASR